MGGKGGSDPQQTGTAITPGQQYAQQQFMPLLQRQAQAGMGGQQLYPTADAQAQGYNAQGYNAPQMPYSTPMDYLQQGEMSSARNVMENFYGQGGGGSATGGGSGAGYDMQAGLSSQLAQGAMGRYMNAQLPYAQMGAQASQFGAGAQNQASQFGASGQNQASMFNAGQQNQAYASPWNYQGMYQGTTGNAMINPGQQAPQSTDWIMAAGAAAAAAA